ncbi:hypothetical protein N7457_008306 [Penicillium paradoxum]|uniref:uncharacterized protein n=1 Tax=Penicillium paradoxum TaxID=176176 RepID=UPI002547ADA5|nr:uncharacterized protein N7457_008306 [Penicillium paradoxum]KAJ5773410.1 hypothetical protein N7457_008306 [Penicillium paradoxum]
MSGAIKQLPPIGEARELFAHFVQKLQPSLGVLHVPSTRKLMEESYQGMLNGEQPTPTNLMLLFSIFSGAALVWSPQLLEKLNATQTNANASFEIYSQLALSILEHPLQPVQPSTTAIIAISTLAHLLTNTEGLSVKISLLKTRCVLMARDMRIHRLDTAQSQDERRLKGCNLIEVEVQRRFWWDMVASDWLSAFSGGPQEGAYDFQPKHMNVNFPSNIDDELMLATGFQQSFPLSVPTAISGSIQRVRMANLCREVVDAMPSVLLGSQEPDYAVILAIDKKFHKCLEEIPEFFKMDQESIEKSQEICEERPYITWQRINLHFSFHIRLSRLHRPYHLEGVTNPKYAYSHMICIRSAQTVLELRRAMDEMGPDAEWYPARLWRVVQHVFLAALILATDVSFNPNAPDAEARKTKVLAAYKILEQSKQGSGSLVEGVQRNMQTLLSTLQRQSQDLTETRGGPAAPRETGLNGTFTGGPDEPLVANQIGSRLDMQGGFTTSGALTDDMGEEGWQQLWSDFVAVAPDLDVPQWNSLLDDVDFGWLENTAPI